MTKKQVHTRFLKSHLYPKLQVLGKLLDLASQAWHCSRPSCLTLVCSQAFVLLWPEVCICAHLWLTWCLAYSNLCNSLQGAPGADPDCASWCLLLQLPLDPNVATFLHCLLPLALRGRKLFPRMTRSSLGNHSYTEKQHLPSLLLPCLRTPLRLRKVSSF